MPRPLVGLQRQPLPRAVRQAVLGVVVLGLSAGAVWLRPAGAVTALWWPAAGAAVIGMLLSPREERRAALAIIVVASGLGNMLAGQTVVVSALFGVCNAAEAGVTSWLLLRRADGVPRLRCLPDVALLVVAVAAGSVVIGLSAGIVVAVFLDGSLVAVALKVFWSHASAQVLLVPGALTSRGGEREAGSIETVGQWVTLLGSTVFVFGPTQTLPITLVPVAMLVWAAARGTTRTVVMMMASFGIVMSLLTAWGGGPFAAASPAFAGDQGGLTTQLVQIYLLITAFITLTLATTVQERREVLREVMTLAARDALTGVLNRHGMDAGLTEMMTTAATREEPFALALIDVDDFKGINDRLGHLGGDRVLIEVAERLNRLMADGPGMVARLGGDEFVVVIPDVRSDRGSALWHDTIQNALGPSVHVNGHAVQVGISVGVVRGDGDSDVEDLLRVADARMYQAKASTGAEATASTGADATASTGAQATASTWVSGR